MRIVSVRAGGGRGEHYYASGAESEFEPVRGALGSLGQGKHAGSPASSPPAGTGVHARNTLRPGAGEYKLAPRA